MIARRDDEMNVIRHQRYGMNRDALFLAALEQTTEKKVLFAGVREEAPAIVASQNDMVRMVRNHEETSRQTGHGIVVDQGGLELCFRGAPPSALLSLGFSRYSVSPWTLRWRYLSG